MCQGAASILQHFSNKLFHEPLYYGAQGRIENFANASSDAFGETAIESLGNSAYDTYLRVGVTTRRYRFT